MKHSLRSSLVPVAAALAIALAAAPLLAADAPAAVPQGPVAGYLRCLGIVGLTDAQKADVKALLEAERPKLQALHETRKADREALVAAATAANPDACVVGAAFLKVEADTKAIGAELRTLFTAIEALLTPEQKAKLEGCLKAPKPNSDDEGEAD